jgi:hypothetical protein
MRIAFIALASAAVVAGLSGKVLSGAALVGVAIISFMMIGR